MVRTVLAVLLRGLRRRWWLSCGVVVLTVSAVVAGAIGPLYLSSSMTSLRVDRVEDKSGSLRNLTWEFDPDGAPGWSRIRADAVAAVSDGRVDDDYYAPAQVAWTTPPQTYAGDDPSTADEVRWRMEARPDLCQHVRVLAGRCPRRPGEMMVAGLDVERGGYSVGSETDLGTGHRLTVVGAYALDDPDSAYWYDPVRYVSTPYQDAMVRPTPYTPAPFLVVPGEVAGLPAAERVVRVDRALQVPADLDQPTLSRLAADAAGEADRAAVTVHGGTLGSAEPTELGAIRDEIESETEVATRTILPATLSLIIVCVVLLFRLVSAAADLRRPEIALLKVRGWTGRRLRGVTLAEPLLLLILGWSAGVALVVPCGSLLTDAWLRPGTPTSMSPTALAMTGAVLLVAIGAVVLATRSVATESLRQQLEVASAPPPARRSVRVLRFLAVGAAVVAVALAIGAGESSRPSVVGQSMPAIVGIATAILTGALTVRAAGWLVRRTARRPSTVRFLQARALARRRDGTLLVLPIAVALTVSVFAAGVWTTAAQWRESAAAAEVGAAYSYQTRLSPIAAKTLTHRLDPDGEWLMAAAYAPRAGDLQLLVDSPRLESVATWPDSWTGSGSLPEIADELRPVEAPEIRGTTMALTGTSRIDSAERTYVTVTLLDASGGVHSASLGPYHQGATLTRSARVGGCRDGCEVIGLQLGAVAGILSPMKGTFGFGELVVDGREVDAFAPSADWQRAADNEGDPALRLTGSDRDALTVAVDSGGRPTSVGLVPSGTPAIPPAIVGRDAPTLGVEGSSPVSTGPTAEYRLRRVRLAEALPVVGSIGVLADLTTMTRASPKSAQRTTLILAADDVPDSVIRDLSDAGVKTGDPQSLSDVRAGYDNEAYALAMRLYLLTAGGTLVLAMIGVIVSLAVQVRSRRRDAAALRVAGVRERSVWLAGVLELSTVITTAAVSGALAGAAAARIVTGGTRLGTVEVGTPRVLTDLDLPVLALLCGSVVGLLTVVSAVLSRTVVRSGRPSTLRAEG